MKTRSKRLFIFAIALLGFFAVLVILDESHYDMTDDRKNFPSQSLPLVAYQNASASTEVLSIEVFGELKPKWDVLIKSQVNGKVIKISPDAEAGARVQQGDLLVGIDPRNYQAQLDQAKLNLEQAKLELLQAKQKTALAQSDWERSGLATPPSDLMLFKPQLAVAEQNVESAISHYALAVKTLSDTSIAAPFAGVIVARNTSKGQVIEESESLFRLVDDQFLSLEVSLGELQWADLAEDWQGQTVTVYSMQDKVLGQARLDQGGHILDTESRQFRLYLSIPGELRGDARAGQFVRVNLPGQSRPGLLNVPESALSQDGTIWIIKEDNSLFEYAPEVYFRKGDRILAAPPLNEQLSTSSEDKVWRIAIRPLSFFLSGKTVSPNLEKPLDSQ